MFVKRRRAERMLRFYAISDNLWITTYNRCYCIMLYMLHCKNVSEYHQEFQFSYMKYVILYNTYLLCRHMFTIYVSHIRTYFTANSTNISSIFLYISHNNKYNNWLHLFLCNYAIAYDFYI